MLERLRNFWRYILGGSPEDQDGYGQTMLDDARSALRFRAVSRQSISWSTLKAYRGDADMDFPVLDRFGDDIIAYYRNQEEDWFIIDRVWHGWPDPPQFAFFAFDAQKRIVTGQDFSNWPEAWIKPE